MIYSAFLEGDFTVKHTASSVSGVRLDQALQKEYNISPQKVLPEFKIFSKKGKCPELEYHTP